VRDSRAAWRRAARLFFPIIQFAPDQVRKVSPVLKTNNDETMKKKPIFPMNGGAVGAMIRKLIVIFPVQVSSGDGLRS